MSSYNTHTANDRDLKFKDVLANAADTIQSRLRQYDDRNDPIERSRLKLLYDIVSLEIEKAEAGATDSYSGLNGPIKAVTHWGEPSDSGLMSALRDVETYHHQNYWL